MLGSLMSTILVLSWRLMELFCVAGMLTICCATLEVMLIVASATTILCGLDNDIIRFINKTLWFRANERWRYELA